LKFGNNIQALASENKFKNKFSCDLLSYFSHYSNMFVSKYFKTFQKSFILVNPPKTTFIPLLFANYAILTKVNSRSRKTCHLTNIFHRSNHERLREGKYSKEVQKVIDEFGSDSLEMANFLEAKSIELDKTGDFEDALEMALIAKNIYMDKKMTASEFVLLELIAEVSIKMRNYNQAIFSLKEYIKLKESIHGEHDPNHSGLYYKLGSVYYHVAKFQEAYDCFMKAFNLVKEVGPGEVDRASYLYYFIGLTAFHLSRFEEAKENARKALEHYEALDDQKTIYRCSHLLGLICEEFNDADGGALYFKRALLAAEEAFSSDSHEMAVLNYLIGKAEYRLDRIDTAMKYTMKALDIFQKQKDKNPIDIADALYNLSLMYYKKKEIETALKYLNETLDIYHVFKDKNDIKIALVYENKGMALETLDRDHEAKEAFEKAIAICDAHKDTESHQVARIYYNIARIYSEFWPEKIPNAKEYAKKALKIASQNKTSPLYKEIYTFVDVLNSQTG